MFCWGLRENIRLNVKCFQPANLSMAISLAKLQESKVEAKRRLQGGGGWYRSGTGMLQERRALTNVNPNVRLPGAFKEISNSGSQRKEVAFTRLSPT